MCLIPLPEPSLPALTWGHRPPTDPRSSLILGSLRPWIHSYLPFSYCTSVAEPCLPDPSPPLLSEAAPHRPPAPLQFQAPADSSPLAPQCPRPRSHLPPCPGFLALAPHLCTWFWDLPLSLLLCKPLGRGCTWHEPGQRKTARPTCPLKAVTMGLQVSVLPGQLTSLTRRLFSPLPSQGLQPPLV